MNHQKLKMHDSVNMMLCKALAYGQSAIVMDICQINVIIASGAEEFNIWSKAINVAYTADIGSKSVKCTYFLQ